MKPDTSPNARPKVVIGTIGSDAHVTGQFVLTRAMEDAGIEVVRLGACVPQEEFIEAAVETGAHAVLVSSLYGMAFFDCQTLREKCTEAGLGNILLYIGGHLGTNREKWEDVEARFSGIGFDRVYSPESRPAGIIEDLKKDIAQRQQAS
ncbi:MAG: methylaspartate mutase subunit S [Burkholderiaceae bacterium]|nr:methylaspartate mutase subunit S [Burkholderiaceae bacterium]